MFANRYVGSKSGDDQSATQSQSQRYCFYEQVKFSFLSNETPSYFFLLFFDFFGRAKMVKSCRRVEETKEIEHKGSTIL